VIVIADDYLRSGAPETGLHIVSQLEFGEIEVSLLLALKEVQYFCGRSLRRRQATICFVREMPPTREDRCQACLEAYSKVTPP